MGVVPESFAGALAGRMAPKGTANWSRNSGSGVDRLKTTWFVAGFTTTPPLRVQVAGLARHAAPPTMTLYHEPALGLDTLNRRWKEAWTSLTVTA